jgi:RND family efflux transporter MFP subunit
MSLPPKAAALALSVVAALSAATIAAPPQGAARRSRSGAETVAVGGYVDWLEKSDVSALVDGVVDKMELKIGSKVKRGGVIGTLHAEKAQLTVAKAKVASESTGAIAKGEAQKKLALADLARMERANKAFPGAHSPAEIEKGQAELQMGVAVIQEAKENKALAEAELKIADQILADHTIRAPFDGIIIERMKNPQESVKSNEAVVRLGKIDTLKFFGDVPIENSYRIKVGDIVDLKPEVEGVDLPIEQKRFRGKVTYVAREIVSVNKTVVTIFAEIQNNKALELLPGLKAVMTVYVNPDGAPPPPDDALPEPPAEKEAAEAPPAAVGLAPR